MSGRRGLRGAWFLGVALAVPLAGACSGGAGPTTSCGADATACLTGTVTVTGFTAAPNQLQVSLFREFPSTGAVSLARVADVAQGGTWAFGGLSPWAHYYVEAVASFGQPQNVAAIVGPLTVPSTAGPVGVQVKPAQITILEQSAPGAPLQLQSAQASLFDPSSGAPLQGATVTITVGGTAVPMPWTSTDGTNYAYSASFTATPTPAQATYTVTSTAPGAAQPVSWQLVADHPAFTPSVSAPANLATVPASQPLTVTWAAQAAADEELVVLYSQTNGGWSQVYKGPAPDDEDVTTETIPGSYVGPAGEALLLNVSFVTASCPATADGCVAGEVIVPVSLTAK